MRGWTKRVGAAAVAGHIAVSCSMSGDVEVTGSDTIDVTDPTTPRSDTPSTDETTKPTRPRPRPTILSLSLALPPTPGPGGPDATFGEAALDDLSEEIAPQNGITKDQARSFVEGMLEIYTIDEIIGARRPRLQHAARRGAGGAPRHLRRLRRHHTADDSGRYDITRDCDWWWPGRRCRAAARRQPGQVALVQSTALDHDTRVFFFRNDSSEAVAANTLAGTVIAPDGTALSEISVDYSVPDTVGPGSAGMFVQFSSRIGGPFAAGSTVDVTITSEPAGVSSFLLPMEINAMTVAGGTLVNSTGQDIESAFIEAACFDDAGAVLDFDIELPNTEVMAAGATLPITFAFDPGCTKVVAAAEGFAA